MASKVTLVDRGRGMQLSTSRITVMDLVPYFQHGDSPEEIMQWIPALTPEEIAVAHAYYREHKDELDAEDRQVRKYREEQVRLQRKQYPPLRGTKKERMAKLRERLYQHRQAQNGEGNPG
jgi:uncharacterized protein (DUF433 family)